MSKAALKKALKQMESDALVELICEMYDARREARDYLEYWIQPDPEAAFGKAREEVYKKFFYSSGKTRGLPAASDLKKLVKDYSSISFDPERIASLMLYLAETQAAWLAGRTSGYAAGLRSLEKNVEQARLYIEQSGLEKTYGLRLEKLDAICRDLAENPPEYRRGRRPRGYWYFK